MGLEAAAPDTQDMLFKWADRIVLTDKRFVDKIPAAYSGKLKVYDVGRDRWHGLWSRDLRQMFYKYLETDPL